MHCGLSSTFAHTAHHSFTPGCKKFLRIFVKLQLCTRNSYVLLQLTLDPVRLPGSTVKPHILLASVALSHNCTKTKKNPQNNDNKKAAEFQGLWLLNLHKIFSLLYSYSIALFINNIFIYNATSATIQRPKNTPSPHPTLSKSFIGNAFLNLTVMYQQNKSNLILDL